MGKERDALIRQLGGTPLSDRSLTDTEILQRYYARFLEEGRLPPHLERTRRALEEQRRAEP